MTFFIALLIGVIFETVNTFYFFIYNLNGTETFLIIHIVLAVCIYIADKVTYNKRVRVPVYFAGMIPFFGFVFTFLLYTFLFFFGKNRNVFDDYEKYIQYISEYLPEKNIDFNREINTASAYDNLYAGNDEKKKNVIIDIMSEDMEMKVNILKMAVKDENSEVVHYASSTLNFLEKEYEKNMDKLKSAYLMQQNHENLKRLIEEYEKYIVSGLTEGELLNFYINEYMQMIDKYIENYGREHSMLSRKANGLLKTEKYNEAIKNFNIIKSEFGMSAQDYLKYIETLYYEGDYGKIAEVLHEINEKNIDIPEKYSANMEFWKRSAS